MNSHPLEVRVVLLALKAFSRVLLVLGHSRMTCTLLPFAFFAIMMKN